MNTTAAGIYRALIEALCYGAQAVVELFEAGGLDIGRLILTSGLARNNPFLVQTMADVMGRTIEVPEIANGTAVGAAIHGAVAAGVVADYAEGGRRFGARVQTRYSPRLEHVAIYRRLYAGYRALSADRVIHRCMEDMNRMAAERLADTVA